MGRSRHWKDVIRTLTRGHTDRLSAEPMLKYFQPLEMWLKVQNREENVIGWNIYVEDNALFQPLLNNSNRIVSSCILLVLFIALIFK